ncbi:putative steroid-binding protein 3 [Leucoagaricus sp. SymC.cos]|nr:putative steroid-binding protein 3 [Leucoagaricus sp. SymC.cos]
MFSYILYVLVITVPAALFTYRHHTRKALSPSVPAEDTKKPAKSIMQPPRDDLLPPKDDPMTTEELKQYDGSDPSKSIYVAIKGDIFDVSHKADSYGPGKSYNIFAGKDGSRGLGRSSLKTEDAVADYSVLDEKEMKVLNEWHSFFLKRYNVVGKVSDGPKIES